MTTCVDFDFQRLLFPAPKTGKDHIHSGTTNMANNNNNNNNNGATTTAAGGASRVPLHPRNPNHGGGGGSGATTTTHSSSGDEGLSNSSSKEGSTRSCSTAAAVLNRMSVAESSNNENNKRIPLSLASSMKSIFGQHQDNSQQQQQPINQPINLPETSTITHTGAGNSRDVVGPTATTARGRSAERQVERQAAASSSSRSSSAPRSAGITADTAKRAQAATSGRDDGSDESVLFEERRSRVDGEGYTIHQYLRGRLLGKGGFAKVYFCTALDTNKNYAVKVVPKANLVKARARQKLQAEIKIHRTLKHKHICEYKHFFEDRENCYILLELCHNQSLNEMLKRRKRVTEPEARYLMAQLLQAVAYMHDQCVIHRDLKLGNLFLDRNLHVKVGDLGLATRLSHVDEKRKTICGTPNYIAPEVIQGSKETRGHSFEVDIWSMGVILYTVLIGKPPYEAKDVKSTYQRIIANEYSFPTGIPISDHAKDLIISMLQTNPVDRPRLPDIARHSFLTAYKIPLQLPANATHVAPEWCDDEYGDLMTKDHIEHTAIGKKLDAALSSNRQNRRPFMSRDPNTEKVGQKIVSEDDRVGGCGGVGGTGHKQKLNDFMEAEKAKAKTPLERATPNPRFAIHDDFEPTTASEKMVDYDKRPSRPVAFKIHEEADMEQLVSQTAALSLRPTSSSTIPTTFQPSPGSFQPEADAAASIASAVVANSKVEQDMLILKQMHDRLTVVLEVTDSRKFAYGQQPCTARPLLKGGPNKWVVRYVDYTSKYGLGFLLSDGSSGVYFNDSTKAVIEMDGEVFQYVERHRPPGDPSINNGPRRGEPTTATYNISTYPKSLQKKVTLLKHFRNYLVEQQKNDDDEETGTYMDSLNAVLSGRGNGSTTDMVYVKKWIRTKHAILFRLSDQTVQIVFYDQTEVLLTPDERFVTFVDKTRVRCTYYLSDELVGCNEGLAKRLKYCREILQQLLSSPRN